MKSTDMKQTSETRKNFEEGWDAIFGDNKKIRRNREKPRVIAPIIPSLSSLLGEVPGEFDEAIKNSHGCSPDFLKEDSGTIKDSLTVAMGEVVSHLKGEIELPSRVYPTDAHNESYTTEELERDRLAFSMAALRNNDPTKSENVKMFESMMIAMGCEFTTVEGELVDEGLDS